MSLRIGISACIFHSDPMRAVFKGKTLLYMEESTINWMLSLGAFPVLIPREAHGWTADKLLEDCDGLILQGGVDVAPESYGEKALKPEWSGDKARDDYEIALIHASLKKARPILGICRGAQVLNVALGGTLYQDIATQVPSAGAHRNWDIYDAHKHEISVDPGSCLATLYKTNTHIVNTIHHQGLKDLGRNLAIEAHSVPDKMIEAVRYTGKSFALGLQWHPEFHTDTSFMPSKPIFEHFISKAREFHESH